MDQDVKDRFNYVGKSIGVALACIVGVAILTLFYLSLSS